MKPPLLFRALILSALFCGHASAAESGDAGHTPTPSPVKKGALLFSDDFSAPELAKSWRVLWPALAIADGAMNISQAKPEHSAVGMVPVGRKDVIIGFKFKLGAATSINAVCNDRDYKEGHGGHICRVSLLPRQILLADDKERLSQEIEEMKKDPARQAEVAQRVAGRSQAVPMKLDPARWYELVMEIAGRRNARKPRREGRWLSEVLGAGAPDEERLLPGREREGCAVR